MLSFVSVSVTKGFCFQSARKEEHTMTISFELPQQDARESYLVDLYRQDLITHHQLAQALGLSRYETDGVLKQHQVSPLVTAEEMREQSASLRGLRPE
jgi:hypothetical protein